MRTALLILILLFSELCLASKAIQIEGGKFDPCKISVTEFLCSNKDKQSKIKNTITLDLGKSGIFEVIPEESYIEHIKNISKKPDFASWRYISSKLLLTGKIHNSKAHFVLWDCISGKQILNSYVENDRDITKTAHRISDAIYKAYTSEEGYYNKMVVFVSEDNNKKSKISIIDQDGKNMRNLTNSKFIVLTPIFSPSAKKIMYLSFKRGKPQVYLMHRKSMQSKLLGDLGNMSFAPRFSPCGNKAIFAISKNGATNIYDINLTSGVIKQITDNIFINISPCYSPDGKKITFNSNRSGRSQIYVMDLASKTTKRISYGKGSYTEPIYSPNGKLIAFTKVTSDLGFVIGIMREDGSDERIISFGYTVENPSWLNNRTIGYSKTVYNPAIKNFYSNIYYTDIITGYEEMLPINTSANAPCWSN